MRATAYQTSVIHSNARPEHSRIPEEEEGAVGCGVHASVEQCDASTPVAVKCIGAREYRREAERCYGTRIHRTFQ